MTKPEFPPNIDLQNIPLGDPVLVILWNDVINRRQQENPQHSKQRIIQRLIANGGRDQKGSNAIFHFRLTGDIQSAREDFLANDRWVFGTTPEMEAALRANFHIDPVAETYVVTRITMNELDYADARFFYY